jgi:hypothetical protein
MEDVDRNKPRSGDRPPRRQSVESAAEEAIREAMARGDFDNLPGKGQPLRWDTERDDEWWLANHMLRNAGYRPAFIERDQHIRAERAALTALLADHEAWHRAHAADEPPEAPRRAAEQVVARFREQAARLNREIDGHNATVPVPSMQRVKVQVDAEIAAFYERLGLEPSA